ncbi:MAG: hypothetical protein Q4C14_04115 [Bacillota bacterium]|nr:hypothetical protein [Bacillota bacterium]
MVLDVLKEIFERYRRKEKLRRQLRMTRKCSRELDILLGKVGIDYSKLELCPVPEETEKNREK